ncbi:MAG: hotdog fold thioesterase [Acidimicrobiales bacterium]|nr:hotdog fold thioesterase [Acidimicrobiales bacterium]
MDVEPWPAEPVEVLLGIEVIEQSSQRTVVEMIVAPSMLNDHGICHGGILFLLADAAMGRTANSSTPALATHAEVDFMEAVSEGARLRARAVLRRQRNRLAIFDVSVAVVDDDDAERVVAEFRGRTLRLREPEGS